MTVVARRVWPAMTFIFLALVTVIVVLLTNVGSTRPAPFTLNSKPDQQIVRAGSSAGFRVVATFTRGYHGRIELAAGQLPVGISVRFSRSILTPGAAETAEVTVTTTTAISPGTYEVSITGRDGNISIPESLLLVISSDGRAPTP